MRDLDFIMTETETEAYILENNLIKKHSPKYNIRLKDDKSYPYVTIDTKKKFPRLLYQRRVQRGPGKKIFGPFTHNSNISEVLRIIIKSFQLRDCTDREMNQRKEPCILYQMHQCTAPCVNYVSPKEYDLQIKQAIGVFSGKATSSLDYLKSIMHQHAENEEFEKAAQIRDHLISLEKFVSEDQQKNVELDFKERDVDIVAFYVGELEVDIAIYLIRNNYLLGHKNFHFSRADTEEETEEEVLRFLLQYYNNSRDTIPKLVAGYIQHVEIEQMDQVLSRITKKKVKFSTIQKRFQGFMTLLILRLKNIKRFVFKIKTVST